MKSHLDTIIRLQATLDELGAAEAMIHGIPDWMRELHDEHSERKAEIDAVRASFEEAAQDRRTAEAGTADAQDKLKHFQEQIGRVRNQREYSALLQEIDAVKQTIKDLEEQAIAALEQQEAHKGTLEEQQASFGELDERYAAELAKWEKEKPGVARRAEELRQQAAELREGLPRPILSQFELIFDRYEGQAMAEVLPVDRPGKGQQMWRCGSCNYRIRPQSVVEIRNNGSVVLCDSCKRILFINDSE